MLTIAGGIVLGGIILFVLAAIASTEEGCAFLVGTVALVVVGGALFFAYAIWGKDLIEFAIGAAVLGIGYVVIVFISAFVRQLMDASDDRYLAKLKAKLKRNREKANDGA